MTEESLAGLEIDEYTRDLLDELFVPTDVVPDDGLCKEVQALYAQATEDSLTGPIIDLFAQLKELREKRRISAQNLGFDREQLADLARQHSRIDEHGVTVGGRLGKARPIVETATARARDYVARKEIEAPSGIELWDRIQENVARIKQILDMDDKTWDSYAGQLRHAIDSVDLLARILDLSPARIAEVTRVTQHYRMRLTPYYASLIMPGQDDDPVLIQSVPTHEMIDNAGIEIPPVAADHSPARLVDQFYPRVVAVKATNMCAMYCTHCLRIAHIGKKDRIYAREAYREALDYVRGNKFIRDVLVTGGDAFILPNKVLRWLLEELDSIDHVRMKRLGTRIPVTAPQRVDSELLDILEESNDKKPLRVVTQINTAQEITPVSRESFRQLSKRVSAVLNQAVLLKGINDSRVKMWKLCETVQEAYVRPYYVFNCSYRNPQFAHLRVPVETGRDIIESMYGNISGDAIPRYIATAGGKIPLHRSNVVRSEAGRLVLRKPWSGELVEYPDAR
jgi:lysine 2,3-aminomutase